MSAAAASKRSGLRRRFGAGFLPLASLAAVLGGSVLPANAAGESGLFLGTRLFGTVSGLTLATIAFVAAGVLLALIFARDPKRLGWGWMVVGVLGALAVATLAIEISQDVMRGGAFSPAKVGFGAWIMLLGAAGVIASAFSLLKAQDDAAGRKLPKGIRPRIGWYAENHRSLTIIIGMALVTALLPLIVLLPPLNGFLRQDPWLGAFSNAGVFVLLALGLNIVVGLAGLLDLGYAAFFAIGAYTYAYGASPFSGNDAPFELMLVIAAVVAATFGLLLGAPTLRLRGDYLAIVTLGFGEIVPLVFLNAEEYTNGTNGIGGLFKPSIAGYDFGLLNQWPFYILMAVILTLTLIMAYRIEKSRLGRAWMAIREDELAAASSGINTVTTKLLAFALGASTAGFAGVFNAAKLTVVSPDQFLFTVSFTVLAMVVLGGMGNIWGVAAGAFIVFIIQQVGLTQMNQFFASFEVPILSDIDFVRYQYLLYGLALVLMMLLRPEGLFPSRQRRQELHAAEELGGEGLDADLVGGLGEAPK